MQASKNYELFCKTKINLHCHTLIFFYVYWFIYSDMVRSIRGSLMISLFFFWTYPTTRQRILNISLSRIFCWCNLAISMSRYLENRTFWNRSRTFCSVPSEKETVGLDCIFSKTSKINSTISAQLVFLKPFAIN